MSETEYGFEVFHWCGQKRYRCNQVWESGEPCSYDHYDLEEVRKHAASPHNRSGKKEMKRRMVSPIVGPSGEAIVHDAPDQEVHFKPED